MQIVCLFQMLNMETEFTITPNQMLDDVLSFIYTTDIMETHIEIDPKAFQMEKIKTPLNNYLSNKYMDDGISYGIIGSLELVEILAKLAKDGYLNQNTKLPVVFATTFEGRWFIQKGGYTTQSLRESSKAKRANLESKILTLGAATTGVYGLVEIVKTYIHWKPASLSINLLTASFLFSVGILAGIATVLIMQEVLTRKDNK